MLILEVDEMTREELEEILAQLRAELRELDGQEPKDEESGEYEEWADAHEDLEDQIDEVMDRLDEMRS